MRIYKDGMGRDKLRSREGLGRKGLFHSTNKRYTITHKACYRSSENRIRFHIMALGRI